MAEAKITVGLDQVDRELLRRIADALEGKRSDTSFGDRIRLTENGYYREPVTHVTHDVFEDDPVADARLGRFLGDGSETEE